MFRLLVKKNSSVNSSINNLVNNNNSKRFYFKNSNSNRMKIIPVRVNSDNYSYLILDEINQLACAVDPCEPDKVVSKLKSISDDIEIDSVLTTHHHWDHSGGNNAIKALIPTVKVYGGDERIEGITNKLKDNQEIIVGSLKIKTLNAPAHTKAHVLYLVEDENDKGDTSKSALFTGDTLFVGGCGRLFEGNPEQMYHALYNVIGKLPNDTKVYVGHEYTLKNLEFAKSLESNTDNPQLYQFYNECKDKLSKNHPTVPSSVGKEKEINPFMRCHLPSIYNNYLKHNPQSSKPPSPIDVLGFIRKLKDNY